MTDKEFENEYKKIFERAVMVNDKTRREGLLSIDDILDNDLLLKRDIMETGFMLTNDGTDSVIIDNILTNIISLEDDEKKKILKTVQKTAVLLIHRGCPTELLALTLSSLVDIDFENVMKQYLETKAKNNEVSENEEDDEQERRGINPGEGEFYQNFSDDYYDKYSKEQIRGIYNIHEKFARIAAKSLSTILDRPVSIELTSIDKIIMYNYKTTLPNLTTVGIIRMEGMEGFAYLELPPAVTFTIVDIIRGGDGTFTKKWYELPEMTDMEKNVIKVVYEKLLEDFREAWSGVMDLRPSLIKLVSDPKSIRFTPDTEGVVHMTLEIKTENLQEMINLAVSYAFIEKVIDQINEKLPQITDDEELSGYKKQYELTEKQYKLAVSYLKGSGGEQDYAKAGELFRGVLEKRKELHGEEEHIIASTCFLIACEYREHGDYEIAVKYYKDALVIYEKFYNEKHQDITDTLCFIAICYEALCDYENAVNYFNDTIASDEEVNGKDNQNIAYFCNLISSCYVKSGDYYSAQKYSLKALAIREKILGEDHTETAYVYHKIADNYYYIDDYENALTYYNKAFKIYEKNEGRENIAANNSYVSIGVCYEGMKEYEKAIAYYKDAAAVYEKISDSDKSDTARIYFNIADCYYELKDYENALENDIKALNIRKIICEEDAPELALSYNNLGAIYRNLGKYDEAIEHHLKALEFRKKYSKEKDVIAFAYNNTGKDYEAKGDKENALKYFKEALSIYESLEGFDEDTERAREAIKRNEE